MATEWTPPTITEAVRRLVLISEHAQSILFLEGDFGHDTEQTRALTALLDDPILPHDWEVARAFVNQGGT